MLGGEENFIYVSICSVLGIKLICKYEIGLSERNIGSGLQRINGIQLEILFTRTWFEYIKQPPSLTHLNSTYMTEINMKS